MIKLANYALLLSSILVWGTVNAVTIGLAASVRTSQSFDVDGDLERSQSNSTPPVTTFELAQYSILKIGDSGPYVSQLQENLTKLDIYHQAIHGRYDKQTKAAVSRFQKYYGLPYNGIADAKTQAEISKALHCGQLPNDAYVVVIPKSADIHLQIARTMGINPKNICEGDTGRGQYFRIIREGFTDYRLANSLSEQLRAAGFDARIEH